MDTNFLLQAIIYLTAAVICVPIAKKLGLSSILGYLLAGIIIGPFVLGFIGQEGQDIMHFAEFGVVMMLFLIGLELEPSKFWKMRKFILGMGSMQLIGTTIILFLGCLFFMDWRWETTLAISLALALSSTAIVLQTLKEKGLSNTSVGRSSFAVLLFQDIAVIPILAFLPLLSTVNLEATNDAPQSLITGYASWLQTVIVIGIISTIYFAGRFLFVPLLHIIAKTRLQELFTASALLLVVGVSYMMQLIGLSPALGAFMAGVVLANSEFRHELEGDIAPFKGLLLGLFFLGVGASINFQLIIDNPLFIFAFGAILTLVKFIVLFFTSRYYKKKLDQNLLFAFGLSQAGEFGFVIMSFCMQLNIIPNILANQIMAVIAMSMVATPFLLLINERIIYPNTRIQEKEIKKDNDYIDEDNPVIIAGFGHFGSTVGRLLRANQIKSTILDYDSDRIDLLRKMGFKVYYGDATRLELLKAAGCENAKVFIAAIDNPTVNLQVIETLKKHFPNLKILTRARNRNDAYELIDHKVEHIYRETLYSAVNMGVDALVELGLRKYTATRQGQQFIKYDEITTRKLAEKRHDKMAYLITIKEEIELQEQLLKSDIYSQVAATNHSWDSQHLKNNLADLSDSSELQD
ncbi:MAG: monovalent cation:proton antiporter-2 (CPA2) family protein [Flavobacterium sp.]|jgi:CPA2 family monovalent cation:H+ antiporter-2|uniref:monovalent cation:proton antiporter-2 (CPA2) family protein n=1 Tax=unclassified Flavobacterium TaxID=196869 RepID=UPI000EB5A2DE|nr:MULTISPECIES: monovalent cation:proton antiporter-2 (CPA2) family protein [unclassified Flavobacterium]MDI6050826.1 monovalent cation:proton antiporter-2 (CPA2) family protein [Flavobacterium sp. XS2P24]MDP3680622.1 monovalent cation:proton antiporter-2 (CPA2) family protein [Flavobacterium sp.]MDZ4331808.1 monovalent cation:proton antiporter-2 (CPA2) family protein [Flavobacterium sp.]RKS13684.1 Kef-type potassium/proton antiporter (CPA2 family) [Flavobacterium sp. 120]WKL44713.1 monovalen